MNHSIPTPELQAQKRPRVESVDIDIAMFGIKELKGKAPFIPTTEELVNRAHNDLVQELKELYALIDVSRLAIENLGQSETDSAASVLMVVINRLFDLIETQEIIIKKLEQEAKGGDQ